MMILFQNMARYVFKHSHIYMFSPVESAYTDTHTKHNFNTLKGQIIDIAFKLI